MSVNTILATFVVLSYIALVFLRLSTSKAEKAEGPELDPAEGPELNPAEGPEFDPAEEPEFDTKAEKPELDLAEEPELDLAEEPKLDLAEEPEFDPRKEFASYPFAVMPDKYMKTYNVGFPTAKRCHAVAWGHPCPCEDLMRTNRFEWLFQPVFCQGHMQLAKDNGFPQAICNVLGTM